MENPKITILIVVPSLRRAGAETQSIDLANGLAKTGHTIHLAFYESDKDQLSRVARSITVHCLQRRSKFDLGYIFALSRIIDEHSIDVVHGVMQFASVISWVAARKSRSRPAVVAAIHTTVNVGLKDEIIDRTIFLPFLRRMDSVIFVCNAQKDHWLGKYPRLGPRSVVIYNGIDTNKFANGHIDTDPSDFRLNIGVPENSVVFSCIAGFRAEKGHDLLISAFAAVSEDAYLLLAGDGPTRSSIKRQIDELGLGERVRFLGNLADVRPLIAATDATILASTAVETFSIAMLESLSMSVPVIAPKIGGLSEAVFHGRTGFLFNVGDEAGLTNAMQTIVDNPQLGRTMGAEGRKLVIENFSLDQMLTKSLELLLSAAKTA